ncbi:MAG: Gldg family protein [Gammaproteobacteria bacterium]|nr:MAG: Gldg family protein [Gammaproteobacteria bacterium]
MQITARTRLVAGVKTAVFVLLLLAAVGMLAWLSEHNRVRWDWTAAGRNTLTEPSRVLLLRLSDPIEITAYVREEPAIRQATLQLLERYQRYKPDIRLRFVNPDLVPEEVRARKISTEGEMIVSYRQREERAKTATEEALTTALERLARADTRWIGYTSGRGERDLLGAASYDLGKLGEKLQRQGFKLYALTLGDTGEVPAEAAVLMISPGREDLPADEVDAVLRYLDKGGNLLWLAEPGSSRGMEPVASALGIAFEPGTIVDPTTQVLGISSPAFVPVSAYSNHPVTKNLELMTVYPYAVGIAWSQPPGWRTRGILSTGLRAWSETGDLTAELRFDDATDVSGPLDIGIAMQRTRAADDRQDADKEQRVIVIGDGDFLSNAYLGGGSNLDLALNIFNWLAGDETLIDIPARSAPDLAFELSPTTAGLIRFGVMFALPALILGIGFFIWRRRRRL